MHTTVVTEGERERRFMNEINKAFRHCRVGKVTSKVKHYDNSFLLTKGWFPDPASLPPVPSYANRWFSGGYVHQPSSADVPIVPAHGVLM